MPTVNVGSIVKCRSVYRVKSAQSDSDSRVSENAKRKRRFILLSCISHKCVHCNIYKIIFLSLSYSL